MQIANGDHYAPDFSNDFFEAGGLEYDKDKDAYIVEDVDYCIDYAMDWKNGTGDFYCDDNNEEKSLILRLLTNLMITEKE